jgi:hypothetical protein
MPYKHDPKHVTTFNYQDTRSLDVGKAPGVYFYNNVNELHRITIL